MEKKFFIFVGRSGCGKGTQAELLKSYLEGMGLSSIKNVSTGEGIREFNKDDNYIATLSRYANEKGVLQPEFLAVWNWSNLFINKTKEEDSIILDGAPRKLFEVHILHSAINFMGFENPTVIYLDVSENCSKERLKIRMRADDINEDDVNTRLYWFETEVLPVIDLYKNDERYRFIHVNGESYINDIHEEIISKLEM